MKKARKSLRAEKEFVAFANEIKGILSIFFQILLPL